VGNDIIDITSPENLVKHSNERLVLRVLSVDEQSQLLKSNRPELVFLAQWAAKESAYKLLKKRDSNLLFAHAKFHVTGADSYIEKGKNPGQVTYAKNSQDDNEVVNVEWQRSDSWLHCIARCPITPAPFIYCIELISSDLISGDFSEEEQISIYSDQSKAVRNLAKKMLRKRKIDHPRIIRHKEERRFSPPWIYADKKRVNHLDLSLSHDGKFMAAVLAGE